MQDGKHESSEKPLKPQRPLPHDLRHDFASWLTMNGVAIRGVQTLLGHADLRMAERYSYLAERVLAAAVEVLPPLPAPAPLGSRNENGHGMEEQAPAGIPAEGTLAAMT